VPETAHSPIPENLILNSLTVLSDDFKRVSDGVYRFVGQRPDSNWHAHGWCRKYLTVLVNGTLQQITLFKPRWRLKNSNITAHSRPANDPVGSSFCSLIVVLQVAAWLYCSLGFLRRSEFLAALDKAGSNRTVQRSIARCLTNSLSIQQAIRQSLLDNRNEPRPEDDVFRRGRSPPEHLVRRCRCSSVSVSTLWRAFDMLFVTAKSTSKHVSILLAEVRRRWFSQNDIFPL
jgi:hypothetical protein